MTQTPIDIEEIEKLANAAKDGCECYGLHSLECPVASFQIDANPATILALCARVRELEAKNETLHFNLREVESRNSDSWKSIAEAFQEKLAKLVKVLEAIEKYCDCIPKCDCSSDQKDMAQEALAELRGAK
jgi:hypothetical protein